ncbi:prostate-associated microseminoprotein-like [Sardina pilchardus]|uniref:prostate-associated microseminoprotein-like n=1 Tax=Sardina pilchardus TaxID=27697 RepID=UPI002E12382B
MRSVGVLLMLCALAALAHSYCWHVDYIQGDKCEDEVDKTIHTIGTTWTNSRCHQCICSSGSMSCCDQMGRVIDLPADCEVVYDWKQCNFRVVEKNDKITPCREAGSITAVGK